MQQCWDPNPVKRPTCGQALLKLEEIMVQSQITNPKLCAFWMRNWGGVQGSGGLKESVGWDDFCVVLEKECKVPRTRYVVLQQLLCGVNSGMVTMERLDFVQNWFGDFFSPDSLFILDEMVTLCSQEWFMPDVTKEQSDMWLDDRPDGTFLVRLSFKDPLNAPFTISRRRGHETIHRRVQRLTLDNVAERYTCETSKSPGYIRGRTACDIVGALQRSRTLTKICPKTTIGGRYL
eukprot:TRINITY_DN2666_c0_g1_i1.p2 TRINITY_DN2666_c0_g1~~TRINITY_DN2666_c0_g1_i1.p2  ORF type:complete len:234 (-),score=57.15 TRINITY_DN2666_c0_g1_i1:86-787(-)